ncbi:MAG: PfkB family carbohydrate kinase [Clostridia bacterium]|nr:PfkB family carbohydrate kinase [Clostridia bacterium]
MMYPSIVGIGANVCDTLITVPHFPVEDTKLRAHGVTLSGGGPCATGLVAAAKLGSTAAYIGALACDAPGRFLLEDMKRFGLCCDYVKEDPGAVSFSSYILLSEESGSRTCVFTKSNLPSFRLDSADIEAIKKSDILMVDGNELDNAVLAAKTARKAGVPVLYDAGGMYDGIERLLELTDILIPSEDFAIRFTAKGNAEDAAIALYERFRPKILVVTQGKNGGILLTDNGELKRYPAFHVDTIDSNGAGDVFHGAFAHAIVTGMTPEAACVFSSAVSALKCTRLRARDGVPHKDKVYEFLKENGYEL